jgi:hypothetical protein
MLSAFFFFKTEAKLKTFSTPERNKNKNVPETQGRFGKLSL